MTTIIRIDNCLVQKSGNSGVTISSINFYQKLYKIQLEIEDIPFVFTGSRKEDAQLIRDILDHYVNIDTLPIQYPTPFNILK
jgi:hypothetical protein